MQLPEICVRRPVFATVLSTLIVLVGIVSYDRLTVREYPNIDPPVVNVETTYPGASASIIESQVTQVLEDALAGLEGVDVMTSISREQFSQISLTFHLGRDPEAAAADVRDRVARGRGGLPDEVDDPVVQRVEADANPIIWVAFSSDRHNRLELTEFADRQVKDRLQALPGVAFVRVFGSRYTMRLWLDPERLAAHGLTPADVEAALRRQNVEVPAGRVEGPMREFTVLSETDLRTEDDFNRLIIRSDGNFLVRLQDVGHAELGPDRGRFAARFRGQEAIALGIVKQSTANPLDISEAIRGEIEAIRPTVPDGMRMVLAYDSGVFIKASINNVFKTIAEATVLVALIIFFFLRTWRATLIPLVTIPVSLIGACSLMWMFGFSINTLTLLAAVLAIGMVVDDAIVVLENIHRHVESGMSPRAAAMRGGREIGFAVIAMTLTLAAVYAPIGLQGGTTGKLFTEFAWTLAGAVIVSGFIALTLSPMMCSVLLRQREKHGPIHDAIGGFLERLTAGYRRAAAWSLDRKALVIIASLAIIAPGIWSFMQLKPELAPTEDRGLFLGFFQAPEGATLQYTDGYARRLEQFYAQVPEIERYFTIVGFPVVTQGLSFVRVTDWAERERSIFDITAELRPKMFAGAPGVIAFPITPASLGQGIFSQPVRVVAGEASGAPPRRLWVLGASLGGPQAVKAFLGALPPDIPAAFVLAQHIGRSFVPLLAEQLGRACGLRVAPAQQGQRPMAGEVLVTPSDRRLTFTEAGLVELRDEDIPGAYRPSIDDVLERAAEAYGPRVGAVIFSGMGGDGALGCEEVVRRGGTVLVQDADSCVISSMPDAARARVTIAGSGDPIDLARQVVELTSEADVLSG